MRNYSTADRSSVQAVERAADLLFALAAAPAAPTLRELAASIGCSTSTVLRLLTALEKRGLVERDPLTRRYGLGPRVHALASARSRGADLSARALPHMRALRDQSGESVVLQVRAGDQHICLAQVESRHEIRRHVAVGQVFPLTRGATAQVLRAFGEPAAGDEAGAPSPADQRARAAGLPRGLAAVRAAGYAVSLEEREPGVSAIAAPIFDAHGRVWAALVVSGPAQRFGPPRMRAVATPLRLAALAISREQGYRGPYPGLDPDAAMPGSPAAAPSGLRRGSRAARAAPQ
jgi:DNA-binding IclR family transcriptional regulator